MAVIRRTSTAPPLARPLATAIAVFIALSAALSYAHGPAVAQTDGTRAGADATGLNFGAAATVEMLADDGVAALLDDNVNMVSTVAEVDFGVIQPQQGTYDFSRADAVVDFAVEHEMTARGHGLISRAGLPAWIVDGQWTAETLAAVLVDHVTTVVGHYAERNPGVVTQWDVVDEAFLPDGSPRDSIWRRVIGDDYIRIAFEAARDADPSAELFYDDFYDDLSVTQDAVDSGVTITPGATTSNSTCDAVAKCVGVRGAITGLVDAGVPIDGIGIQAHLLSPDPLDLTEFTSWIGELGLRWAITEFDVPLPLTETANPESLAYQAGAYATALSACVDAPGCDTFVTWGITDRVPPVASDDAFGGGLWFDGSDARKPAGDAIAEILEAAAPAPTTSPPVTAEPDTTPPPTVGQPTDSDEGSSAAVAVVIGLAALAVFSAVLILVRGRRS